jgi:hypothetical protein
LDGSSLSLGKGGVDLNVLVGDNNEDRHLLFVLFDIDREHKLVTCAGHDGGSWKKEMGEKVIGERQGAVASRWPKI